MKIFQIVQDLMQATLLDGQLVSTKGKYSVNDGEALTYLIQTPEQYDKTPDGVDEFEIANDNIATIIVGQSRYKNSEYEFWNGSTWEQAASEGDDMPANDTDTKDNFPYSFKYPANSTERSEMLSNVVDQSIGYGGSTWWVRPVAVGRKENGSDVIYRCDTYGSPEDRDLEQGSLDFTLWTNKRLGEAVTKVTRLDLTSVEYSAVGINDKLISYREDEHHQPATWLNRTNGQLITSWGSRNNARTQEGADVSALNYIRYGQDVNTLSASEVVEYAETADYAQGFFAGNTSYCFSREGVGRWHFTRGSGGQNYSDPTEFFNPGSDDLEDQYYFALSYIDRTLDADPQSSVDRSLLHMFGQPHPTANPDTTLRYCQGEFILAGQESSPFDGGGLYVKNVSDDSPVTGTSGLLDSSFIPAVASDIDQVYTPPAGSSCRLLDVQYDVTPRCLFVEFVFDWVHGNPVPYGKTYDLKLAQWNGASWDVSTLKTGLLGALGYRPTQSYQIDGLQLGTESYTSFYVLGASFYRGSGPTDVQPIVYLCHRDGQNLDQYKLDKLTLNAGYTAVSAEETLAGPTNKILYRPEMTLYGDKRVLWYNEADGWSSFNSFVAKTKWIDETA